MLLKNQTNSDEGATILADLLIAFILTVIISLTLYSCEGDNPIGPEQQLNKKDIQPEAVQISDTLRVKDITGERDREP